MSAVHYLRVTDDNGDEQFVPQKTNGIVTGNGCYTIYDDGVEVWSGSGLDAVKKLASLITPFAWPPDGYEFVGVGGDCFGMKVRELAPRKISLDDELEEKSPNDAANVAGG